MFQTEGVAGAAENAGVLAYLGNKESLAKSLSVAKQSLLCSVGSIAQPYLDLGTHPELVQYLWEVVSKDTPEDCRAVVYGTPALIRPASCIIFGLATGTHICALRIPLEKHASALADGATEWIKFRAYPRLGIAASEIRSAIVGQEWLFCFGIKRPEYWGSVSFEFAGNKQSQPQGGI